MSFVYKGYQGLERPVYATTLVANFSSDFDIRAASLLLIFIAASRNRARENASSVAESQALFILLANKAIVGRMNPLMFTVVMTYCAI